MQEKTMLVTEIALQRLYHQQLFQPVFKTPAEVVAWMGAVQAQDYLAAKWAVGQRMVMASDAALDRAFADGTILRTHLLRPTWHFVTPADIRWLLALTAPHVRAVIAYQQPELGLDEAIFHRSNAALAKALQSGKQLTRPEMVAALQQAGIHTDGLRLTHLLMRAELDGIICSGPRQGKQFTYALLDERAPQARTLNRDEALADLTRRYFTSHGPATLKDFTWWSGLTTTDAKAGLEMNRPHLLQEVVDGKTYWRDASAPAVQDISLTAYLLPNYDEYIVGYTDRSAIYDVQHMPRLGARGNVLFNNTIVMDGRVVGTWKRAIKKDTVVIEATLFVSLTAAETDAFTAAARRYGEFLGLSAVLA